MDNVDWSAIEEAAQYERVTPGAYAATVTDVVDKPDKKCLFVHWDFAEEPWKGSNMDCIDRNGWEPGYARFPMTYDMSKKRGLGLSKKFIVRLEKSNRGFKWNNKDPDACIGKFFALVLGEEEYKASSGEIKKRLYVADWLSGEEFRAGEFKVPELRKLKEDQLPHAQPQAWTELTEDDGELPF